MVPDVTLCAVITAASIMGVPSVASLLVNTGTPKVAHESVRRGVEPDLCSVSPGRVQTLWSFRVTGVFEPPKLSVIRAGPELWIVISGTKLLNPCWCIKLSKAQAVRL
jgi:hypothetical protein